MSEVDMRDVEKYQKQTLGRFYYKVLPYGTKADKLILAMFGQILEKAPMTDIGETLLDLVKNDIGETSHHRVVAMVGRSGAGKTARLAAGRRATDRREGRTAAADRAHQQERRIYFCAQGAGRAGDRAGEVQRDAPRRKTANAQGGGGNGHHAARRSARAGARPHRQG